MKMIPASVEKFITDNAQDEEEFTELWDYADCLINDEGIVGDALELEVESYLSCLRGTCSHYTCTEGQALYEWEVTNGLR